MTTNQLKRPILRYEHFGGTTVLTYPGWVECHLPGGLILSSLPEHTQEYEARARDLGFQDGDAMNRQHHRMHAQLAAWLGLPVSPALRAAALNAHDEDDGCAICSAEEAAVMALHRYTNLLRRKGLLR